MEQRIALCIKNISLTMNLNRIIRIYLLLLFALLQGVAPFAHAHVNGQDVDHGLYEHVLSDHHPDINQLTVEPEHCAVVYMPPVSRSNDLTPDLHVNSSTKQQLALPEYRILSFVISPQDVQSACPYQHPCSQAPPA